MKIRKKKRAPYTRWTDKEDQYLIAHYMTTKVRELAATMNKTEQAISTRVRVLRGDKQGRKGTTIITTLRKNAEIGTSPKFFMHKAKVKAESKPAQKVNVHSPKKYATRVDTREKRVVMIDHRTAIYVDASLSESQVQKIKSKYKPLPR